MYNSIWYDSLTKPLLTPPEYIFPPVWIFLYATLLIALILYSIKITRTRKLDGYICFIIQLLLNLAWSPAFFIMRNIGLALFVVILMDIFVFLTIIKFFKVSKMSGLVLIPYFLWIVFATYLNAAFYILN